MTVLNRIIPGMLNSMFPVLLGCVLVASCAESERKNSADKSYDVMVLRPLDRELSSTYPASIQGKQDIDIRPKVSGYITDIKVREGSIVKKGQPLFIIDQTQYKADLQTAEANVNVAKALFDAASLTAESKEQLYTQKIISKFDLDMAKTNLEKVQSELEQAKAKATVARNNLEYTIVKSPADGVVGTLPFRVGTLVTPSDATPLTTVSDNSEMYIYFSMTESQVLALKRLYGSLDKAVEELPRLRLKLNDGSIYEEEGRIEAISGILDKVTGTVTLRAKFPNPKRLLISGGSGNVLFPHTQKNCAVIPQKSTYEVQDVTYACKYSEGKAKAVIIQVLGISDGREYIVESGLELGDTIIVEGAGMLRDGSPVEIKNFVEHDEY